MTYSLAITGIRADNSPTQAKILTLSDANALAGNQAQAQALGTHFLCKRPDGSERYFRIDAERSVPGQAPILVAVGNH